MLIDAVTYKANLTKGSLKVGESRVIAGLLLEGLSPSEVQARAQQDNLLQKKSPEATRTLASHLLWRLSGSPECLLRIIAEGSNREATQACLACLVHSSALFRDCLRELIADVKGQRRNHLAPTDWSTFLEVIESRDAAVRAWTPPVRSKLRQNIWRVLAEAEVVLSTKHMRLQTVLLEESVKECLQSNAMQSVLDALALGGVE